MPESRNQATELGADTDDARYASPLGALLGDSAFVRIWIASGLAGTVRWLETLAVGVFTYQTTESPLIVAGMLFARMLPTMLLGVFVGAIAETVGRRRLLLVGSAIMSTVSAALAVLVMTGQAELWHIAAGAILNGMFASGEFPVLRTMLGEVAGLKRISAAMGLDAATHNATRMLGPLLGGVLLAVLGLGGVYALSVVLYTIAFACILTLTFAESVVLDRGSENIFHNIREGFVYIRTNRLITATLVVTIIVNLFGFAYISMMPIIGEQQLRLSTVAIGVLTSAEGLGALIGALSVAVWARARHFTAIYMFGSVFFLCMILGFSLSSYFAVAFLILFAAGLGIACFGAMQSTIVFSATAPRMRTRVMGVLVVCIGAGPIGILHLGLMAEWLGAQQALSVMAIEGLLGIAISALLWPELRREPALSDEMRR
jgi:MFS family permease